MKDIYVLGTELASEKVISYYHLDEFLMMSPSVGYKKNIKTIIEKNKEQVLDYLGKRYVKKIDSAVQLSLFSTESLMKKINLSPEQKEKTGVFLGNNYAGWAYVENQMYGLYTGEDNAINSYVATAWFPAAAQGELSIRNNLFGISKTFSLDQLSSAVALDFAIDMLHSKKIDYAITGGHESLTSPIIISSLAAEGRIGYQYPASEAASSIVITNDIREKNRALGIISHFCQGNSLKEVIENAKSSINHKKIDYCIFPPINLDSIDNKILLKSELITLHNEYATGIPVGMPSYFMGEICGASFATQLSIALWVIEKQYIPYGYMKFFEQHLSFLNLAELVQKEINTIMIIGRDYYAKQYVSLVLDKNMR